MDFLYVSSHWQLILLALSQISWLKRSLTWGFQHKVVMMSLSHSLPAREDPSGRWWYSQRRWSPSSGWRWSRCRTRWWPPRRCTCPCRPPAQHTWFISRSGRSFDFYKQCREENARETSCQNNLSHLSDNKLSVTFVTLNRFSAGHFVFLWMLSTVRFSPFPYDIQMEMKLLMWSSSDDSHGWMRLKCRINQI